MSTEPRGGALIVIQRKAIGARLRISTAVILAALAAMTATLFAGGCAAIPKEVVELSYQLGNDLTALHLSYEALVREHFDTLRARRIAYLEDEWVPVFIGDWIQRGRLIDTAQGEVVWSEEEEAFVTPEARTAARELVDTVQVWADEAILRIEEKREQLLAPLDADEQALLTVVRQAFANVTRANAHITAHLNSLRKVQEVQDQALEALDLKDLRDRINQGLITTSEKAARGLEEIREADRKVSEAADRLDKPGVER